MRRNLIDALLRYAAARFPRQVGTTFPNLRPNARDRGNANVPGVAVRQQTRDVAFVLREARTRWPRLAHFVFVEDDFRLCPHGLAAIHYALAKADAFFNADWIAVRASFGLNGA